MELPSPKSPVGISPTPAPRRGRVWARIIAVSLIFIGALIVAYPLWPKLQYALNKPDPKLPYQTRLVNSGKLNAGVTLTKLPVVQDKPIPKDNWLVIPSIGVNMKILEGPNEKTLDRGGIWHIPNTSNPTLGSNTVLSGHRWMYLPPSSRTLYLLDKVAIGEPIIVYWQGVEYDYRVARRDVVNPNRVDILNATAQPQLTIFTCTPLFSTKQRLVLYGELIT